MWKRTWTPACAGFAESRSEDAGARSALTARSECGGRGQRGASGGPAAGNGEGGISTLLQAAVVQVVAVLSGRRVGARWVDGPFGEERCEALLDEPLPLVA
jgi:hypothetical protein